MVLQLLLDREHSIITHLNAASSAFGLPISMEISIGTNTKVCNAKYVRGCLFSITTRRGEYTTLQSISTPPPGWLIMLANETREDTRQVRVLPNDAIKHIIEYQCR